MLAGPRKLVTWIDENYYVALLNTCSGIFKLYFKFWKGRKTLASLRKGLSAKGCTILHTAGSRLSLLCVWGVYSSEKVGQAGGRSWAGGREQRLPVSMTQLSGNHDLIGREPDCEPQEIFSLCPVTTKGKGTKSQLSLKGSWTETKKQRPQAKSMPEGTWVRERLMDRQELERVLKGFREDERKS